MEASAPSIVAAALNAAHGDGDVGARVISGVLAGRAKARCDRFVDRLELCGHPRRRELFLCPLAQFRAAAGRFRGIVQYGHQGLGECVGVARRHEQAGVADQRRHLADRRGYDGAGRGHCLQQEHRHDLEARREYRDPALREERPNFRSGERAGPLHILKRYRLDVRGRSGDDQTGRRARGLYARPRVDQNIGTFGPPDFAGEERNRRQVAGGAHVGRYLDRVGDDDDACARRRVPAGQLLGRGPERDHGVGGAEHPAHESGMALAELQHLSAVQGHDHGDAAATRERHEQALADERSALGEVHVGDRRRRVRPQQPADGAGERPGSPRERVGRPRRYELESKP